MTQVFPQKKRNYSLCRSGYTTAWAMQSFTVFNGLPCDLPVL